MNATACGLRKVSQKHQNNAQPGLQNFDSDDITIIQDNEHK